MEIEKKRGKKGQMSKVSDVDGCWINSCPKGEKEILPFKSQIQQIKKNKKAKNDKQIKANTQ
ncbi:hypothetical protein HYC85_010019 [Camellia sinensis]|uniref:Uncharacterized protein n=1 Tax=Camellia sinensis TaxID=4442 RepID=A0A7J7HHM9_CAMSI|nr:hypothetical protein HYC85_010019 [Camellia sinensis]